MKAKSTHYWLVARCETQDGLMGAVGACKWFLDYYHYGTADKPVIDSEKSLEAVWSNWASDRFEYEWPIQTNAVMVLRREFDQLYINRVLVRRDVELWLRQDEAVIPNVKSLEQAIGFNLTPDHLLGVVACLQVTVPLTLS